MKGIIAKIVTTWKADNLSEQAEIAAAHRPSEMKEEDKDGERKNVLGSRYGTYNQLSE